MDSRKGIEIERKFAFVFREWLILIRFLGYFNFFILNILIFNFFF